MVQITIDLQEGFTGDTVVIHLNGREVYRQKDVSTRMQIGLADRVETQVQGGNATLEVELPDKGLRMTEEIACERNAFVGINVHGGVELTQQTQFQEFWYA